MKAILVFYTVNAIDCILTRGVDSRKGKRTIAPIKIRGPGAKCESVSVSLQVKSPLIHPVIK